MFVSVQIYMQDGARDFSELGIPEDLDQTALEEVPVLSTCYGLQPWVHNRVMEPSRPVPAH